MGPLFAAHVLVLTTLQGGDMMFSPVLTACMLEERVQLGGAAAVNTILLRCVAMHSLTACSVAPFTSGCSADPLLQVLVLD